MEKIIKYLEEIELCGKVAKLKEGHLDPIKLFPGNLFFTLIVLDQGIKAYLKKDFVRFQ